MQKINVSDIRKGKFTNEQIVDILKNVIMGFSWIRQLAAVTQDGDREIAIRTAMESRLVPSDTPEYGTYTLGFRSDGATLLSTGRSVSDDFAKTIATPAKSDRLTGDRTQQAQYTSVDMSGSKYFAHVPPSGSVRRFEKIDGENLSGLHWAREDDGTPVIVATSKGKLSVSENAPAFYDGKEDVRMDHLGDYDRHSPINPHLFLGEMGMNVLCTDGNDGRLVVGSLRGKPTTILPDGFALRQSWDIGERRYGSAIALSFKEEGLFQISEIDGDYDKRQICSIATKVWAPVKALMAKGVKLQGVVSDNALIFNTEKADQPDVVIPFSLLGATAALTLSGYVRD